MIPLFTLMVLIDLFPSSVGFDLLISAVELLVFSYFLFVFYLYIFTLT